MADENKIFTVNRGTATEWQNAVRVLEDGEFGWDRTNKKLKIGDGMTAFDDLKAFLMEGLDFWSLVPVGLPIIWTQPLDQIPYDKGFVLADGNNGTQNLMGRYLKTIDNAEMDPGGQGGNRSLYIGVSNLPAHSHSFAGTSHTHTGPSHTHSFSGSAASAGAHAHGVSTTPAITSGTIGFSSQLLVHQGAGGYAYPARVASYGGWSSYTATGSAGAHTHTVSGTIGASGTGKTGAATAGGTVGNTGGGEPLDIMPEYVEIAIIVKIAA